MTTDNQYQQNLTQPHRYALTQCHYHLASYFIACFIVILLSIYSHHASADSDIILPDIGLVNTDVKEEERIGSAWLKQYRRHVSTTSDPILTYHIERLLNKLAAHSNIQYSSLSLVIAKNNTLNAFAVPGGIIGVHTGLLNYAETEEQLAAVLAHELAHLSQRHYARGVEKQKRQSLTTMAALLGSLILAAHDSNAGAAAISATQGLAIDQQLRFSRSFEKEADRLGLGILVRANMNPHAISAMFEQMSKASRFSSKPPEFLLTHPLSTNRMIDAINLARKYPEQQPVENINYQFVRTRALWLTMSDPQQAIIRFKNELSGFSGSPDASRYGLALALIDDQQYDEASKHITALLKNHPDNHILKITQSDIIAEQDGVDAAIAMIDSLQTQNPDYYPLLAQLGKLYTKYRYFSAASDIYIKLSNQRSHDTLFWYELAEVAGLNQDISLLHKARAEYFILFANFANAKQQLDSLLKREKSGSQLHQYATQRLGELDNLKKLAKL